MSKDMELATNISASLCVLYHHEPHCLMVCSLGENGGTNGHASMATCRNHPRHGVTIGLDRRSSFAGVGVGVDPPIGIGPACACPAAILTIVSHGLPSARGCSATFSPL